MADGFEYDGTFYEFRLSDIGKDLMLIDKFSGLPLHEFYGIVDDDDARSRAPILLTLIATSIRAGHPDWSVERITRTVMELNLNDVTFLNDDEQEEEELPPASEGETTAPTGESSPSQSKSTSSAPAEEPSETFSATPA